MILRENSPLRNLPIALDTTQGKFLDAIRLSIEFVDLSYSRLIWTLKEIGGVEQNRRSPLAAHALHDSWSIIDSVHRLRTLVREMPRYRGRAPSKQVFLRETTVVSGLRNTIQHVTKDIQKIVRAERPVLGALTWIRVIDRHGKKLVAETLIPGQFANVDPKTLIQIPEEPGADIDDVRLWAITGCANLSGIVRAVAELAQRFENMLDKQFDSTPKSFSDLYAYLIIQIDSNAFDESPQ